MTAGDNHMGVNLKHCFLFNASLIVLIAVVLAACDPKTPVAPASLVVTQARIWTGDDDMPWAQALATDGERILAIGSADEIAPFISDETKVISVPGSMVVPGFIDTHVHFLTAGAGLASVQLRDAKTPEIFAQRIGEYAKTLEPGQWVLYGTWDHENWGGELPQRSWIDDVTPNNPVWINRLDGHMGLANSKALELAGIDANTPNIDGGEIVRDDNGNPTGILKDNAMNLLASAIPAPSLAQRERIVRAAMDYLASNGVTSVHDMADWQSLETYRHAKKQNDFITRIYSVIPLQDWQRLKEEIDTNGSGDPWLRIGGLKGMMDGSLGSHTAAFFDAYTDVPEDRGFLLQELSEMSQWIQDADSAGLHIIVHAIGDRAIHNLLDIYGDVVDENGGRDRRFRIEHAQHIHPGDLSRFATQKIIASMQPFHAIDDGRWADKVIGSERAKTTYAFRALLDEGARVTFGSDWDVAPATPIEGIYAAVTRQTLDGANPNGWVPEQKISVEEALKAYTSEAAYASFEEDIKGMLRPGLLADFVVLDRVLTDMPANEIPDTKVLATIVGGKVVYPNKE